LKKREINIVKEIRHMMKNKRVLAIALATTMAVGAGGGSASAHPFYGNKKDQIIVTVGSELVPHVGKQQLYGNISVPETTPEETRKVLTLAAADVVSGNVMFPSRPRGQVSDNFAGSWTPPRRTRFVLRLAVACVVRNAAAYVDIFRDSRKELKLWGERDGDRCLWERWKDGKGPNPIGGWYGAVDSGALSTRWDAKQKAYVPDVVANHRWNVVICAAGKPWDLLRWCREWVGLRTGCSEEEAEAAVFLELESVLNLTEARCQEEDRDGWALYRAVRDDLLSRSTGSLPALRANRFALTFLDGEHQPIDAAISTLA
jgi:hypothetical protein